MSGPLITLGILILAFVVFGHIAHQFLPSIPYLDFLDDAAYDAVFTENVIFAEYYAASATNSVLECIARHTPMLVNPLPAIVEYLGEDYPLYFTSYEEAGAKAADANAVLAAHEYLAAMDKTRFTREFFLESILNSNVYREAACLQ